MTQNASKMTQFHYFLKDLSTSTGRGPCGSSSTVPGLLNFAIRCLGSTHALKSWIAQLLCFNLALSKEVLQLTSEVKGDSRTNLIVKCILTSKVTLHRSKQLR